MTDGTTPATGLRKHSLTVAGHRTSVTLEEAFWAALKAHARRQNRSVSAVVAAIDHGRGSANLSSAIRVHLLAAAQRGSGGG